MEEGITMYSYQYNLGDKTFYSDWDSNLEDAIFGAKFCVESGCKEVVLYSGTTEILRVK